MEVEAYGLYAAEDDIVFLCKTEELILFMGPVAIIDEENWFV